MTDLKSLLFSLAWCSWSNYHTVAAKEMLCDLFPGSEVESELREFQKIVLEKPGPGSPK